MAFSETQTLLARLLLDTSQFDAAASRSVAKMNVVGRAIAGGATAAATAAQRSLLVMGGLAIVAEKTFMDVQESQAALARTLTGASLPAIHRLNDEILVLSKTIPVAVTELYRIAEVIGTTNVAVDHIDELTAVVAKLAATTDLSADEAAIGMARLLNMFGRIDKEGHIAAGAAESLGSELVAASLAFASSDQEILRASLRFGALASMMKMTEAQVITLAGAVTGLGQEPEAVGGSFQRIFQIINKAVGKGGEDLKRFAQLSGMTAKEFSMAWQKDPFNTLLELEHRFAALNPAAQAALFGEGGIFPSFVRGMQTLQNLGVVERLGQIGVEYAKIVEAGKRGTALNEQFAVRTDTLTAKFQLLQNALVRGATAFGDAFNEEMSDAILTITKSIDDSIPVIQEWGRSLGKWMKSIDWNQAIEFGKSFLTIMREISMFILNLPKPVLLALAGLKAANFLTGGGAGNALTGLLGAAVGRGSPLNPMYVKVLGGLGGPGGPNVGGPLTAIISAASIALIGGAIALALIEFFKAQSQPAVDEFTQIVDKVAKTSGQTAIDAIKGQTAALEQFIGDQVPVVDRLQNLAKLFVTGSLDESKRLYMTLADNLVKDRTLTTSQLTEAVRALKAVGLEELAPAIEKLQARLRPGPFGGDAAGAAAAATAAALAASLAPPPGARDDSRVDKIATAADLMFEAGGMMTDAARKFLDSIKPRHREGEKGKSIQSGEFRRLERIDPSRTDRVALLLGDLVKHYKTEGIGTKEHPMAWIQRSFKGVWGDIAASIRSAMKRGDTAGVGKLIDHLRNLKELGIKLPPGIRRLIKKADDNSQENKETRQAVRNAKNAIERGLDRTSGRLGEVKRAIAQKKLSVKTVVGGTKVNTGNVIVRQAPISVTVGARNVVRGGRTTVAYGPTYTSGGSGSYSIWGDEMR